MATNKTVTTRLQIVIGGSHSKYAKHLRALAAIEHSLPLRRAMGSKRFTVIVPDTAEVRELINQTKGISIARSQPQWLRD